MSVDTTILILECIDGFRVATVQEVESIIEYEDEGIVSSYFAEVEVFNDLDTAHIEANRLEDLHVEQIGFNSEYGIRIFKWDKSIVGVEEA